MKCRTAISESQISQMSKNDELFDAIVKLSIQLAQHERQVEGEVNKRLSRLSDRLDQLVDTYPYMTAVRRIEGEFLYLIMEVSRQIGDIVTGRGRRIIEQQTRSEEHTLNSSHVKISYAVFCLKKKIL